MIYPDFRRPTLEDKELIQSHLAMAPERSCDRTFANIYLWAKHYKVDFGVFGDVILFHDKRKKYKFAFPAGTHENARKAIIELMKMAEEEGEEFSLYGITREQFDVLEEWFPGKFQIEYNRDLSDYVYETEKLQSLKGKSYHGKRNYINRFKINFQDNWQYEKLTDDNVEDCFQMALKWRNLNGCDDDPDKNAEMSVAMNSLRLFHELELEGCLIRANGEVVAFAMGEQVTEDTFIVHIEKAFSAVEGAYAIVNQQFVENNMIGRFKYVNREEDVGQEGLRIAKTSYKPIFLIDKGLVTIR